MIEIYVGYFMYMFVFVGTLTKIACFAALLCDCQLIFCFYGVIVVEQYYMWIDKTLNFLRFFFSWEFTTYVFSCFLLYMTCIFSPIICVSLIYVYVNWLFC